MAESAAGGSEGGVSDHVSRSAVEVWGFLTGTLLSIALRFASLLFFTSERERERERRESVCFGGGVDRKQQK